MKAPSRYYEHKLSTGEIHKFRLTVKTLRKLEESMGMKFEQILTDMGNDPVGSFVNLTWAASLAFNPAVTKDEMEQFYDDLVDDELDQFDINGIIMNILQSSGLSDNSVNVEEQIEGMRAKTREGFTTEE